MELQSINIEKLKPAKYNPRKDLKAGDKEYEKIKKSILEFGYIDPIIINNDFTIIGGHQRYKVLKDLKYNDIQCIVLDIDKTKEKALNIALNKISGEWDFPLLKDLLQEIDTGEIDIELTGFDFEEIENIMTQFNVDDELIVSEDEYQMPDEDAIETDIVIGDLFEIGQHRLLCGDSTDSDQVAKLMNGEKADMAHNDPPYGMKKENEGVLNDNLNYDDLLDFNREWIALQFTHLKENGSFYCWGTDEPLMDIYSHILKPYIKTQRATFRNLITWNKGNGQGQNAKEFRMYPIADEKCLFVMMGVQGFNNNADNYFEGWEPIRDYLLSQRLKAGWDIPTMKRIAGHSDLNRDHWTCKSQWNMPTIEVYKSFQKWCIDNKVDAFKKEYDELKKEYERIKYGFDDYKNMYYATRAYFDNTHDNQNNVWHFDRTSNKERETTGGHATPKPIALCERAIKSSCPDNGLVLDFFLGSGSTMVAAHQLKRKCYGMELDPKYCQVIIDRMRKLGPSLIVKKNGTVIER